MEIQDVIQEIRKDYETNVKPLVEAGNLDDANMYMGELMMRRIMPNQMKIEEYHSGPTLVCCAKSLVENLGRGDSNVNIFEMYLNQLELAVKSGNKF